jgi:large subunit ribosomal protein L9
VRAQTGVEVDRRSLDLDEPIRELGATTVAVRLHADVTADLPVEVAAG